MELNKNKEKIQTYLFVMSTQSDIERCLRFIKLYPKLVLNKILLIKLVIEIKNMKPRIVRKTPKLNETRVSLSYFNTMPNANENDDKLKIKSFKIPMLKVVKYCIFPHSFFSPLDNFAV